MYDNLLVVLIIVLDVLLISTTMACTIGDIEIDTINEELY